MSKETALTNYLVNKYNFSYESTLELVTEQLLGNPTEGDTEIQACIDMGVYIPHQDTWLFPDEKIPQYLFQYEENDWIGSFEVLKEAIEKGGTFMSYVKDEWACARYEGGLGAERVKDFEELLWCLGE